MSDKKTREEIGQTHQTEHLDPALVELGLQLRERAELGRAHGREVRGVREEDRPAVPEPLVEVNVPLVRLRLEVGGWVGVRHDVHFNFACRVPMDPRRRRGCSAGTWTKRRKTGAADRCGAIPGRAAARREVKARRDM